MGGGVCARRLSIPISRAMPMAYNTLVGDMGTVAVGRSKSSASRSARALYKRGPAILFLDDDQPSGYRTRTAVNAAVKSLKMAASVSAHRLETIASAGRGILLANGKMSAIPRGPAFQACAGVPGKYFPGCVWRLIFTFPEMLLRCHCLGQLCFCRSFCCGLSRPVRYSESGGCLRAHGRMNSTRNIACLFTRLPTPWVLLEAIDRFVPASANRLAWALRQRRRSAWQRNRPICRH